eukprot:scaffold16491_cov47-Cyclotella_meneghiniana.AAC.3
MANYKLCQDCTMFETAEEAKFTFTAEANHSHSNNRWKVCQQRSSSSSWYYSSHTPEGYTTYEQFRNGNNLGTL